MCIRDSDTTGTAVQGDFRLKMADATQHIVYDASNARMNFADAVKATTVTYNGVTYQPDWFKNATVVTE